jgi:hypothetical protein
MILTVGLTRYTRPSDGNLKKASRDIWAYFCFFTIELENLGILVEYIV